MRRFFVFLAMGVAFAVFGAVACGDGNKQPPLTPDTEHPPVDAEEAGAPSAPSSAAPATLPAQ